MKEIRKIKSKLLQVRPKSKATLKDIQTVVKCREMGDYTKAHQTKLYNSHSGDYCELLSIIN